MQAQYLSMWEASKVCSYSQEYLSLLSRRSLLKAEKRGNKWFTTVEWLNEYLADKKPGEVVSSQKETSHFFQEKRGGVFKKSRVIAVAVFIIFLSTVLAFDHMSSRIANLEERIALTAIKQ